MMVCPCCLPPNQCPCDALRGVYITVKTIVEPFSANVSFPGCELLDATFSTLGTEQEATVRLSTEDRCRALFFGEQNQISTQSDAFYSAGSSRRVLVEVAGCEVQMSIFYNAFPQMDSRVVCPDLLFFMQRWHFESTTSGTSQVRVNDLSPTPPVASRSIETSASELIGLKIVHDPLTNVNCDAPSNWPSNSGYIFCESGGKLTAEIMSVSYLP